MAEVCVSAIACIAFPSFIPCKINLMGSTLQLKPETTYTLKFKYKVGFPAADTFHLFFYETPEDVRDIVEAAGRNIEERSVTPDPAVSVRFLPDRPRPDPTGIREQEGVLMLRTPEVPDDDPILKYYTILAMSHP